LNGEETKRASKLGDPTGGDEDTRDCTACTLGVKKGATETKTQTAGGTILIGEFCPEGGEKKGKKGEKRERPSSTPRKKRNLWRGISRTKLYNLKITRNQKREGCSEC